MTDPDPANNGHQTIAQLLQQGLFHHRQGDIPTAMERYSQVLGKDPKNTDALYYVAVIACQEEQFKQGVDLIKRALTFTAPQARMLNIMGQALDRLGEPLEAMKALDQAIALDPNLAAAHGNRANILVDAGMLDLALVSFNRALELDPNSMPDLVNRGALLQTLGRHDEALASLDRALALAPRNPAVLNNRGVSLAALGRNEEALAAFDAALAANPRLADAHRARGKVLELLGRADEAKAALAKAEEFSAPAGAQPA